MRIPLKLDVASTARFGGLHQEYRYLLTRTWNPLLPVLVWCMLNPSTADENSDDPTVAKCQLYARMWGYGGVEIVNLFAFRATNPVVMLQQSDPIGPLNDSILLDVAESGCMFIAAWGNDGAHLGRSSHVRTLLKGHRLYYMRLNSNGEPAHPLYLPLRLVPMELPDAA